jgi:hypothetical protein
MRVAGAIPGYVVDLDLVLAARTSIDMGHTILRGIDRRADRIGDVEAGVGPPIGSRFTIVAGDSRAVRGPTFVRHVRDFLEDRFS